MRPNLKVYFLLSLLNFNFIIHIKGNIGNIGLIDDSEDIDNDDKDYVDGDNNNIKRRTRTILIIIICPCLIRTGNYQISEFDWLKRILTAV